MFKFKFNLNEIEKINGGVFHKQLTISTFYVYDAIID